MKENFAGELKKAGVELTQHGPVRVMVGVKAENVEGALVLRDFFGPPRPYYRGPIYGRGSTIVVSTPVLFAYVAVVDADDHFVWGKKKAIDSGDIRNSQERPRGMDMTTFLKLERWAAAAPMAPQRGNSHADLSPQRASGAGRVDSHSRRARARSVRPAGAGSRTVPRPCGVRRGGAGSPTPCPSLSSDRA